jgi:MYND finger
MLARLHYSVAIQAESAAGGVLPRTRATRGWPVNMARHAAALFSLCAQSAMNATRIEECRAAQCVECGGASCTVEHPAIGGSAVCAASAAITNLLQAVAAARGSVAGAGPVITVSEVRGVLVSNAGIAEASADVLLAHLRRYAPPLQLMRGAQTSFVLEELVMLQAPLHCATEAPLYCAACLQSQAHMPPNKHTKWCSRCHCVRYCSRECQTTDWRRGHQKLCGALAALRSGSAGGSGGATSGEHL